MTWREVRYEDDMRDGMELCIALDDQGDVFVSVLPVGHRIGPTVRLCASGGADRVEGLLPALRAAFKAIARKDDPDPDCEGPGACHGALKWCRTCGDVSKACDFSGCDIHEDGDSD